MTKRHATNIASDVQGMTLRVFARVVGGLMILGAFIALALPISVEVRAGDSVDCGGGFSGLSRDAGYHDAGRSIGRAMYGDYSEPAVTLEQQCEDSISTRRTWGWPIGALGVVVLAGSFATAAPRKDEESTQ